LHQEDHLQNDQQYVDWDIKPYYNYLYASSFIHTDFLLSDIRHTCGLCQHAGTSWAAHILDHLNIHFVIMWGLLRKILLFLH